jgi:hypothetical protein
MENSEHNLNKETSVQKSKFKKFTQWVIDHRNTIIPIFLIFILIITIAFYQIKISTIESNFIIEKDKYQKEFKAKEDNLKKSYEISIDSINLDNAYRISTIFSWSVRSELLRGNTEQVAILMNQFIKTPGIEEVSLIDPKDYKIILSTNKKIEGEPYKNVKVLKKPNNFIKDNQAVIPIYGINELIGYLVFNYQLKSNTKPASAENNQSEYPSIIK